MSRFLFVAKQGDLVGHLLVLNYCKYCKLPEGYHANPVYPGGRDVEECFSCNKSFDGNTLGWRITLEFEGKKK